MAGEAVSSRGRATLNIEPEKVSIGGLSSLGPPYVAVMQVDARTGIYRVHFTREHLLIVAATAVDETAQLLRAHEIGG